MKDIRNFQFEASNIAPNPLYVKYWADLREDPTGKTIKVFDGITLTWVAIEGGGSGGDLSNYYTKAETDSQIAASKTIVVDNLTTQSATSALSARQGYILNNRLSTAETDIATNTSDIESIRNDFNNEKHFLGYYQTNDEIQALTGPVGSYAWSVESGTVWSYDGTTWTDTGVSVPDQSVTASDSTPLVDSGLGMAGNSTDYSRGDHRHPIDTSRAAQATTYTKTEVDTALSNYYTSTQTDTAITTALTNVVSYDSSNNIILRPGTKIAGSPLSGGTVHEILGINEYTDSNGTYNQFEIGDMDVLYNINITYDADRTLGHATADVYNSDGSYKSKEIFAYMSDIPATTDFVDLTSAQTITGDKSFSGTTELGNVQPITSISALGNPSDKWNVLFANYVGTAGTPGLWVYSDNANIGNLTITNTATLNGNPIATVKTITRVNATGVATITVPANVEIVSVNYNRLLLFESDYTYSGTTVTVTNADITGTIEATDKIEVTYIA